jgi:hypothetical protein
MEWKGFEQELLQDNKIEPDRGQTIFDCIAGSGNMKKAGRHLADPLHFMPEQVS